ncbi:mercury methylation ferredoxin HgcB [Desulfocurvibacter africanus]|uniref:mercury methylation ferredoxin HgcB n=1 Tax=Desulfocurvibacter africanus TaxID=873 RepID=UPI0004002FC3|nr:mercury methylation ferredoxin HgcB [Desulfocurvibacter africanus]
MQELRYLSGVASLELNRDKCAGCGMCTVVCPHRVFEFREGKAEAVDRDACMECGACALNCPTGAIRVSPGVGCAQAIIKGWLTGGPPNCDCGSDCC